MIEALQPYADYKESGLPWLEMIPRHWRTARNGILFQQRNDTRFPELPILEVSLRTGVRIREFSSSKRKQVMADASKYKRACVGDLAYNMMRMWQGAVGVAPVDGLVSPAYVVARPFPGTQSRYYTALFKCELYMGEIDAASRGIVKDRNRLYWDQFKQMQSLAPPPDEQAAIVKFLDYANGKIERAIRAKRKLIGLLNEQRQAIIHRAVTRGLDPNVKLKPSGIPWLGDVPEHWEIRRLRASIIDCINGLWGSDPDGESDITCVRVADFDRENLRVTLKRKTTRAIPFSARSRRLLHRGDLLIEKSGGGDKQPVGAVVIYDHDEPAVCSNFVARMPISGDCNSGFINYLHNALYSRRINVPSIKQTTGIQNLDWKSYLSELVAFPPKLEQVAIADFLDSERERFGVAISRLDREIDLLREYRTTLTADVVTGKLDVREAAKRLPDQTDEPLPPDESLEDLVDDEITEEDEA